MQSRHDTSKMDLMSSRRDAIAEWVNTRAGLPHAAASFLAAGEYNENWLVEADSARFVFRINHGSQLGLGKRQIAYEYAVLRAVAPSEVTPRPLLLDAEAEGFGNGVLTMEYLPGRALDYRRDLAGAADTFAAVHALEPAEELIRQENPVADIAAESLELVRRHPEHPRADVRRLLENYHAEIVRLGEEHADFFAAETPVMVNTEVNSGNFLVQEEKVRLADWEKAVVSSRHQDLGHFLVPTTTLWKTDTVLDAEARRKFLSAYRAGLVRRGAAVPAMDELELGAGVLERTIVLRALSWCYMAWYEYTRPGRTLRHGDTFKKITSYLDGAECFLR